MASQLWILNPDTLETSLIGGLGNQDDLIFSIECMIEN
jgi:hypothetical protein